MRIFIGFKYKTGGATPEERHVPVSYGDMTRQVAALIKENSENKLSTVPKIACYITGLEMDTTRLSDASFVSKVNIRERHWDQTPTGREYNRYQGGTYTVERLMPTPYKLSMKADIWTNNTEQKLQLLEQILVLFNPSLEIQTTDNYLDWTSLSVVDVKNINFSSRTIPQGADTEIDVASLEFSMPIFITPPAKVKKLGIVQTVISNVFTEQGDVVDLENLIFNKSAGNFGTTTNRFRVLLYKSNTGNPNDLVYDLTLVDPGAAVLALGLDQRAYKNGEPVDWNTILELQGPIGPLNQIWFTQPSGFDMIGQFAINPLDPTILSVSFAADPDVIPANTLIPSTITGVSPRGSVDAIIDPYKFNPLTTFGSHTEIPLAIRYLMLDDVNPNGVNEDGPDAWKSSAGEDPIIKANSIIEWNGTDWVTVLDPATASVPTYVQNLRTGIKYRWDGEQWLKAFEGEYGPGYWGFVVDQ